MLRASVSLSSAEALLALVRFLNDDDVVDADIFEGALVGVDGALFDLRQYLIAFDDFAEDGVESVKAGFAADGLVYLTLLLAEGEGLARSHHLVCAGADLFLHVPDAALVVLLLHHLELLLIDGLFGDAVEDQFATFLVDVRLVIVQTDVILLVTGDDVELATAGLEHGLVTGHGDGAALVVVLLGHEFRLEGVIDIACAEGCLLGGRLRGGVASLNERVVDDAVEGLSVVIPLAHQLDEVVAVARRVAVEPEGDIAFCGLDADILIGIDGYGVGINGRIGLR